MVKPYQAAVWVDAALAASGWESDGARDSARAISKKNKPRPLKNETLMDRLRPQKKPYPLSRSDIPLPTGAPRFRRATINSMFFDVFTSGPRC